MSGCLRCFQVGASLKGVFVCPFYCSVLRRLELLCDGGLWFSRERHSILCGYFVVFAMFGWIGRS